MNAVHLKVLEQNQLLLHLPTVLSIIYDPLHTHEDFSCSCKRIIGPVMTLIWWQAALLLFQHTVVIRFTQVNLSHRLSLRNILLLSVKGFLMTLILSDRPRTIIHATRYTSVSWIVHVFLFYRLKFKGIFGHFEVGLYRIKMHYISKLFFFSNKYLHKQTNWTHAIN